jgi:FkbM family methyltransferase
LGSAVDNAAGLASGQLPDQADIAFAPCEDNAMLVRLIAELYRRLPIKSGVTRLSFNPIMDRLMKGYEEPIPATLKDGNKITVDPSDYHGRILYLFGTNDIKVSMNANAFLRSGDVFLDIGANYSTIGLAASYAVGPTGAVHLFEPQRRLADRVEAAVRAGGYTNVRLHRVGLMDENASLTIKAPSYHSGRATFVEHDQTSDFDVTEICEVREISAYVGPLVAGRYFGAKVDIEGSEPKVMPWLLAQPNLRFLIFEAAHNQRLLYEQVRSSGLTLFGLERDLLRLRISRVDRFDDMGRFHDLIAVRIAGAALAPDHIDPRKLGAELSAA